MGLSPDNTILELPGLSSPQKGMSREALGRVEPPATLTGMNRQCSWLWDVDLDPAAFEALLAGGSGSLPHDRRWALLRLVEYAPHTEIRRLLPLDFFLEAWPSLAPRMRSQTRRQGMDFYYLWHRQRANSHA